MNEITHRAEFASPPLTSSSCGEKYRGNKKHQAHPHMHLSHARGIVRMAELYSDALTFKPLGCLAEE